MTHEMLQIILMLQKIFENIIILIKNKNRACKGTHLMVIIMFLISMKATSSRFESS